MPGHGRPWPKGVSANPGGRPAGVGRVRGLARRYTAEAVAKLVGLMRNGSSGTIQLSAAVELLTWGFGRPATVAPFSDETGPVLIQFVHNWRDPDTGQERRQVIDVEDAAQRIFPRAAETHSEGQRRLPEPARLPALGATGPQPPGSQKPVVEKPQIQYPRFTVR